jgi:predicted transcriptional regulator of viral defense system
VPASATSLGDTFTYRDARAAGWSKRALYGRRDAGEIEALGRGLYRWATARPADLDLIEIAHRAPHATICLTSALARHDLTDDNPPRIDIALPRTARQPATRAPVRWHRFAADTFTLGRTTIGVDDATIGLYEPARSIIDAFRLRHLVGEDLAVEALRRWLRRPGSGAAGLLELARRFPTAEGPLRRALQILL